MQPCMTNFCAMEHVRQDLTGHVRCGAVVLCRMCGRIQLAHVAVYMLLLLLSGTHRALATLPAAIPCKLQLQCARARADRADSGAPQAAPSPARRRMPTRTHRPSPGMQCACTWPGPGPRTLARHIRHIRPTENESHRGPCHTPAGHLGTMVYGRMPVPAHGEERRQCKNRKCRIGQTSTSPAPPPTSHFGSPVQRIHSIAGTHMAAGHRPHKLQRPCTTGLPRSNPGGAGALLQVAGVWVVGVRCRSGDAATAARTHIPYRSSNAGGEEAAR